MITVYVKTQTSCQACDYTLRWLDSRGFEYEAKSVEDHMDEALSHLPNAKEAPIVVTDKGSWSGAAPSRLKELLND